ncbi:MAG: prepilin-type N-terminal cleavage/methylation domain-containing protein [Chloroflexi bacterium]|nr:prepilin-type N-terminal cleavage/methylation domain-containing protein [Chloroflexota bacterium]
MRAPFHFVGKGRSANAGFTVIEVVISLAIVGLLVTPLAAAVSMALAQTPKDNARLAVENIQELARYWITRDASSADTYTAGVSPEYGTFTWRDYSASGAPAYEVTYYYDPVSKRLMRREERDSVVQDTSHVATDIQQESDVAFAWSPGQNKVTVTITPTVLEAQAVGDTSRSGTVIAYLRHEAEPLVSPPGTAPAPPPPPGSVTYYVAATPTVTSGSYVSGDALSLRDADTNFYTVDSTQGGGTKTATWTSYSESMATPATINQVEVRYTGKSSRTGVSMQFYVADASGYPTTADSGFTFSESMVETTHSFLLDAAKVSYINSTRVVYLKVSGGASSSFTLYTNQVLFIASP